MFCKVNLSFFNKNKGYLIINTTYNRYVNEVWAELTVLNAFVAG